MTETHGNYVDGEWVTAETGETYEVRNPADVTEVVGEYQKSGVVDAEAAVTAASAAADDWADTPGPERGGILRGAAKIMEDRYDELAETLVREEGKTLGEADVGRSIDIFYYYAEKARDMGGTVKQPSAGDQNLYTVKEPLGVAGLITPWNYPSAIPAWKIGPALATGNTVVIKPASVAPGPVRQIVECLEDAGLPEGVLNYVTGGGSTVGDTFTTHEDVDVVSFTGSASVGNRVYDAATDDQKRVQSEMGGKNPTIVTDSADIEEAADIVGSGAFGVTGQACTACSRAIVYEDAYEEFVDALLDYAESIEIGPGLEDPDMGPHVTESELEGTLDYIEVGQTEGAELVTGGNALEEGEYENGHFVEPTVFTGVEQNMRLFQEEIFGPVVGVTTVSGYEAAIEAANNVQYGLSASIVTEDHREANRFIEESESGVAKVNDKTTGLELHVPFGGYKRSSTNTYREQGDAGIEFYTSIKTVYDNF
ncbi:MAG: aldehyde dehydrogenase family protein [Halobacteriales archaeon]